MHYLFHFRFVSFLRNLSLPSCSSDYLDLLSTNFQLVFGCAADGFILAAIIATRIVFVGS
jgi:adenine/guanine phosphoribosyltransferase-like PRPP-binding protein